MQLNLNWKRALKCWTLATLLTSSLALTPKLRAQPQHLSDAENLVIGLLQSEQTAPAGTWPNFYGSPAVIHWDGAQSSARTECSTFLTLLLEHSYGWSSTNFWTWMGSTLPDAARYHDNIVRQNGFQRLTKVNQILPGDVLAIVYYPEYQSPSGHVMIVQDYPQPNSSKPLIQGTQQWTVPVIDCTSTYHGTNDTRYAHPGGIGHGTFRLHGAADTTVTGYTWSLLSTSVGNYVPQATSTNSGNHLVIGRLNY